MPVVYDIPLTTRFRGIARRRGMLLQGEAGWGEFSPFEDYSPQAALPWWRAAREAADCGFPPAVRSRIEINAIIPAVGAAEAARLAQASGARTAKVKVAEPGQGASAEADRLAAVREALGPGGRIRIDANGAWDAATAVERIAALDRAAGGLEYAEQPCAAVADLAWVRRRVAVPLAADESIRLARDPLQVRALAAADVAVLKVQPLGGVRACLRLAEALGLPVVVSSAVETSVGLAMGFALAGALPRLDFACGLGTLPLLAGDVAPASPWARDAVCPVAGAAPSPELLSRWAAGEPVRAAWLQRLREVEQLAGQQLAGSR
ncbi:MAG: o-succinylbenzoate synthase [Bifidobacteriaceae bacterium]|nr:o-succinylbenzoate synthase [Bifidobacteriaceae bacterium]